MQSTKVKIRVGGLDFLASLDDNATVEEFKKRLPMTINMTELNGNEKYYNFPESLPIKALNPRVINAGDIMLYQSKTLVLFYDSFTTTYSYTKIGRIDDPKGLAAAIGRGDVTVSWSLESK